MGYRKISACVGCAECISCALGRSNQYEFYCDECETENVELYDVEGSQLCLECAKQLLQTGKTGDCEHCEEVSTLYEYDGHQLCGYCLWVFMKESNYRIDD